VVANPSFEDHPTIVSSKTSFNNEITSWLPASPTPDFQIAPQVARSGTGFTGIRIYSDTRDIEYIENKLNHQLLRGQKYCFSAYIKLGPSSIPTDAFGVHFSTNAISFNKIEDTDILTHLVLDNEFMTFKSRWMLVQCNYTTNGTERWMAIGSFKPQDEVKLLEVPGGLKESYYYVDDVSLVPIDSESECPCNIDGDQPPTFPHSKTPSIDTEQDFEREFLQMKVGDRLILENIYFDIDKFDILPTSKNTLNRLILVL